jgi:hypothetical protein
MSKAHVIYKAVRVQLVRVHASSTFCGMLLPQCLEKYKCQMQISTRSGSHELEVEKLEDNKLDKHLRLSSLSKVAKHLQVEHLQVEPLEIQELKRDAYIRSLRCKFFAHARIEKIPDI